MVAALGGCSGDDDTDAAPPDAAPGATSVGVGSPPTAPPDAPPEVTGVPGIDSADAFCQAWSRFAGSFQVVAVASAFLSADPARAFELEVAASGTVLEAADQIAGALPAELAGERAAVLDETIGAFAGRAETAARSLADAGAGPDQVAALSAAWLDALALRDPTQPDVTLMLEPELEGLVADAADLLGGAAVPVSQDPALVSSAATPLTDAYLAANCPDQGLLAGAEVGS